jgi:hypothetical protein
VSKTISNFLCPGSYGGKNIRMIGFRCFDSALAKESRAKSVLARVKIQKLKKFKKVQKSSKKFNKVQQSSTKFNKVQQSSKFKKPNARFQLGSICPVGTTQQRKKSKEATIPYTETSWTRRLSSILGIVIFDNAPNGRQWYSYM